MRLWGVFGHPYWRGRSLPTDRKKHPYRLRLSDGIRRRQDPPHDEDLERRLGDARIRMGIARPDSPTIIDINREGEMDEAKLHQFVGQMLNDLGGAVSIALVQMGDA